MRHGTSIALCWFAAVLTASATEDLTAAIKLYRERADEAARGAFLAILEKEPENAEAENYLALLAKRSKQADEMMRRALLATQVKPNWVEAWLTLGDAYGLKAKQAGLFDKLGWAQKSLAAIEHAIALDPKSADAREGLIDYCRQAPEIAGGGNERAYREVEAFMEVDVLAASLLKISLLQQDRRDVEIFAVCEKALQVRPTDYGMHWYFGYTAVALRTRLGEGLRHLEACLAEPVPERFPGHDQVQFKIGLLKQILGDEAGARAAFEAAVALNPGHSEARKALGEAAAKVEDAK